MKKELEAHLTEDGVLPPPWVVFPDTHPYSMLWRMGAGESFIMVWGEWSEEQKTFHTEADWIGYFRRFPPPKRWLTWMMDVVWNLKPWEQDEDFDYTPYFERTAELGFGTQAEHEADLDDPKWLDGAPS